MSPTPCVPCCTTPTTTDIPGAEGVPGINGTNGANAYTTLTGPLTVPAVAAFVNASVIGTAQMAVGQYVVVGDANGIVGPATFQVVDILSATSVSLQFKGYPGDVAVGTVFPIGSTVAPSGQWGLPTPLTVYASGTGTALLASQNALTFTVTSPALTLTSAGRYAICARVRIDNANTLATVALETATVKLRRTNNTAADLTAATASWKVPAVVSNGGSLMILTIPKVIYTTTNTNDVIAIYGGMSAIANAGAYVPVEAEIVAIRIS